MREKRIRIISGHFGSGKTEFAVNYALSLRERFPVVGLGDLDVVNPYFRSRERASLFEERGIRLAGSIHGSISVDAPSVSPEINTLIENENLQAVLDTGGDPEGVRLLARFAKMIPAGEYDMFLVINGNRPATCRVDQVLKLMESIRIVSGLEITGLINNTHLLKSTTSCDLVRGAELSRDVSSECGIPVRFHSIPEWLTGDLPDDFVSNFGGTIFPMKLYMRDDWMS